MTDKEVMQMALEWIEAQPEPRMIGAWERIKALRAALAQPEKTDMQIGLTYEEANPPTSRKFTPEDIKKIERKWHDPVAWMWDINNGAGYLSRGIGFEQTNIPFAKHTPLYAIPPLAQPEPEPVASAWAEGYKAGIEDERSSEANIGIAGFGAKIEPARQNPYTTQPQREWVGLTPADRVACEQSAKGNYVALWAAIEAKLKERNKC